MQRAKTGRTCLLGAALLAALVASEARAADRAPLQVTVRREGFVPYVPHASYRINIQVPQAKLLEGWRCCWIEAFSRPVAAQLSLQAQKTVAGNDVDVQLDAWRTESSIRELAPGLFEGQLFLSSPQGWGNHAARIYVHLYQATAGIDNRVADDFLIDPFITVRFMYAPRPLQPSFQLPLRPGDTVPGAPPSQLPHY